MSGGNLKRIAVAVVAFVFISTNCFADMSGYMSNIMSRFGNLAPEVYHLQQRGYYVGGTLHIPPMGQTIQPFSVTLPNIRNNSCGGIDVMMGGFSYLNFKYLVQKLQGIIQAAPALAFEIAIKVLSEKLGGAANYLESISDAINGLNFNSCTAMNGIVTTASNAVLKAINGSAKESTVRQSSGGADWFGAAISNAVGNLWNSAKNYFENVYSKVKSGVHDTNHALEESGSMNPDGLLAEVADDLGGLPADFVDMMRYYLGDVLPGKRQSEQENQNAPAYFTQIIAPCGTYSSPEGFIRDVANGTFREVTAADLRNGICMSRVVESGNGLVAQVRNAMNNIYSSLTTGSDISVQTVNLIEISPIPVYTFMKNSVILGSGYSGILINQLARPIAMAIAAEYVSFYVRQLRAAVSRAEGRMKVLGANQTIKSVSDYLRYLYNFANRVSEKEYEYMRNAQTVYGNFMQRYENLERAVNQIADKLNLKAALEFQRRRM